jgi:hypothetical protein
VSLERCALAVVFDSSAQPDGDVSPSEDEWASEASVPYFMTFRQGETLLVQYQLEAATAEELRVLVEQAHDEFRKDFPQISLFDAVTVLYSKS